MDGHEVVRQAVSSIGNQNSMSDPTILKLNRRQYTNQEPGPEAASQEHVPGTGEQANTPDTRTANNRNTQSSTRYGVGQDKKGNPQRTRRRDK